MILRFLKDESGSESVQMAILLPIILLLVMFITDRFIQYEGLTATTVATNEALRAAVVQSNQGDAEEVIVDTLKDRLGNSGVGWCSGDGANGNGCVNWKVAGKTSSVSAFNGNKNYNLLIHIDGEWCNGGSGHSVTLGVRTHKASLFPSYTTFRQLVSGGPIYHTHTYVIKALIESDGKC